MERVELTPEEILLTRIFDQYPGFDENLVCPMEIEALKRAIKETLDTLPEKKYGKIINLVFGLEDEEGERRKPLSIKEVANECKVTNKRIYCLLEQILRMLRDRSRSDWLGSFVALLSIDEREEALIFYEAVTDWVEASDVGEKSLASLLTSETSIYNRISRKARITSFSQLKKMSEEEAIGLLEMGKGTKTVECLRDMWHRANSFPE